jgi:hypothetical protein
LVSYHWRGSCKICIILHELCHLFNVDKRFKCRMVMGMGMGMGSYLLRQIFLNDFCCRQRQSFIINFLNVLEATWIHCLVLIPNQNCYSTVEFCRKPPSRIINWSSVSNKSTQMKISRREIRSPYEIGSLTLCELWPKQQQVISTLRTRIRAQEFGWRGDVYNNNNNNDNDNTIVFPHPAHYESPK